MSKRILRSSVVVIVAAAALSTLVAAGCSGETTILAADGGPGDGSVPVDGAKADSPAPGDSALDTSSTPDTGTITDGPRGGDGAPVNCFGQTCAGGTVCCVVAGDGGPQGACLASCPDGGAPIACDGPAQCTSASPICCAHLAVGAGQPPNCPFTSVSSACQSTCTTDIKFSCPANETVRLCAANADCAGDAQNPNCCRFTQGTQTVTFCVNDFIKGSGAGTCL